jgi:MFS family permease
MVVVDTYVSEMVPSHARGRYVAITQLIGFTAIPVAALLARLPVPAFWLMAGWRGPLGTKHQSGGAGGAFALTRARACWVTIETEAGAGVEREYPIQLGMKSLMNCCAS